MRMIPRFGLFLVLQGPLSDAMTHAGQLALLRRLAVSPIPPENFIVATIAGFQPSVVPVDHSDLDPCTYEVFVGRKPGNPLGGEADRKW